MSTPLVWLSTVAAALSPVAAAADTGPIGVSVDGTSFTGELDLELVAPGDLLVPGDVRETSFRIRNEGDGPARLTVDVIGQESGGGDSSFLLAVADAGMGAAAISAEGRRVLDRQDVAVGEVVPITLRLVHDPAATNQTQNLTSLVSVRVTLTADPSAISSDALAASDQQLPATGAADLRLAGLAGFLAVGTGAALLIPRRTESEGAFHG